MVILFFTVFHSNFTPNFCNYEGFFYKKLWILKNELLQKYWASSTHYVFCVDGAKVGVYGEVFLAVDLALRCSVGHCSSSENSNTFMVCEIRTPFRKQRQFLPKIQCIHSDKGSLFTTQQYIDFVQNYGIILSQGDSKANQNQVIERWNRTFKEYLREKMVPNCKKENKKDPLPYKKFSYQQLTELLYQSLEFDKKKPHKSLQKFTPNEMEEALFQKHTTKHPKDIALITINENSVEAALVTD